MKIFNKKLCSYNYSHATQLYGCIATEYLGYKVILVLQLKLSLKTHFHANFINHVISHMTHKVDE